MIKKDREHSQTRFFGKNRDTPKNQRFFCREGCKPCSDFASRKFLEKVKLVVDQVSDVGTCGHDGFPQD